MAYIYIASQYLAPSFAGKYGDLVQKYSKKFITGFLAFLIRSA